MTGDRAGSDTGSATLELVVIVPALLLLIGMIVVAGRVSLSGGGVDQAAAAAARQASISRDATTARSSAHQAATAALTQQGLRCTGVTVAIGAGGFTAPVGTPAQVSATVTCRVTLSDLAIPGLPGTRTVTATAYAPLDTYRERTGELTNSDGSDRANPGVGSWS